MDLSLINWWAVLVAALAQMGVGMLWYGPVFGKQWMAYVGITPESMKNMPLTMWQAMIGGLVTALVMATVLSYASLFFAATTITHALLLAFWMWLGFVLTTQAGSFLWEGKPFGLLLLNASQSIVALGVMSVIVVLWR
jgi:hypothetical protein